MKDFKTNFSEYKLLQTKDQTWSAYSSAFDENTSSLEGAESEKKYIFIQGTKLPARWQSGEYLSVLDVGFGLGHNLKLTLEEFKGRRPSSKPRYVGLEIDRELAQWSLQNCLSENEKIEYVEHQGLCYFQVAHPDLMIQVLVGDALAQLKKFKEVHGEYFTNTIYQDAFSPKKNPQLWSEEWFQLLASLSRPPTFLSTYSASAGARSALTRAGFLVENRKGFGPKKSSTIAKLL